MKLLKYNHRYDFGHDWYVQLVNVQRWSLFQLSISWNDYASWPYLQIKSGSGDLLDLIFWVYKFGISISFIGRTWCWDYIDQIDFTPEEDA